MSRGETFAFIAAEKTTYGVRRLCRVLGISKTVFYDWAARGGGPTEAELAEAYAINELHSAWIEHRRTCGARRLTAEIRDRGHDWASKRVAHHLSPKLGGVPLPGGGDGRLQPAVGWAMATHLRRELVLDAVGMALFARKPPPGVGVVHHSDRGSQYTSYEFGKTLRTSGVLASMGRVGSAYDNAMVESFFATLKEELVYQRAWPTRHELEMEVFSYIEGFYNPKRRHSRLGNLSPSAYEKMLTQEVTRTEVSA